MAIEVLKSSGSYLRVGGCVCVCVCVSVYVCVSVCWDPLVCSLPGSSIQGILQARILEWVAILFSRGSS